MKCDDCIHIFVCKFRNNLKDFWETSHIPFIENKGQASDRMMLYSKLFEILDVCGHYKNELF